VTGALVDSTVKAALWLAAGNPAAAGILSASAVSLMEGVMRSMFLTKMKWPVGMVIVGALVGAGVGLWNYHPALADAVERKKDDPPRPAAKEADEAQAAAKAQPAARPLGTWERDVGPNHITLRIEADRLYGTATLMVDKDKKLTLSMDADYSVTADGILYGVITGVDVPDVPNDSADVVELAAVLPDQPFSVRFRVDRGSLTIKDLRCLDIGVNTDKKALGDLLFVMGRYKRKATAEGGFNP
jgi:hypothetical protein